MEALTATKQGFTLTVVRPRPGERTLRGRCQFSAGNAAGSATLHLGLISRKHNAIPFPEPWLAEFEAAATQVTVKPGPDGAADFELPYAAGLAPFRGQALEIAVVVVARTAAGTTLRLILEGAPPAPAFGYRVRGLPKFLSQKMPLLPVAAASLVALTLAFIVAAWRQPESEIFKAAFGGSILSLVFVLVSWKQALRWFRLGAVQVRVEEIAPRSEPVLRVSVAGGRTNGRGKAKLVAAEYIYADRSLYKYDPMVCLESPLRGTAGGSAMAEVSLPPDGKVPPSLRLLGAGTRHGILWELRLEMENRRGGVGRLEIPITVTASQP